MTDGPTEEVILDEPGIKITTHRICISTKTYVTANIASVSAERQPPPHLSSLVLMICGGYAAVIATNAHRYVVAGAGLAALAIGVFRWVTHATQVAIKIGSTSGESVALISRDAAHAERIVTAINDAIARRP